MAESRVRMSSFSDFSVSNSVPVFRVCWWFVNIKTVLVLPNHQHTLKMGKELFTETSEDLHILMRLCARENFIFVIFFKKKSMFRETGVVTNMSPEMDRSSGDRRALTSVCFYIRVAWLIAGGRFTESKWRQI